jgi:large subunit ribosomal protein L7/L12
MESDDAARIDRLECQVSYLLQYLGINADVAAGESGSSSGLPAGAVPPELLALILSGKKIQAIKMYRQMTGMGLKDAKDIVDGIDRDHGLRRH